MKNLILFISIFVFTATLSAQDNFTINNKLKNGIDIIYYKFPKKNNSNLSEYRYGLYDENTQKIILPMQYENVWTSNEDNIFLVKDTTGDWRFYYLNNNKGTFSKEVYGYIKSFTEGLAIVSQRKPDGNFRYGAVDKTGKIIIPLEYKFLSNIGESLISFGNDNKGYGYIDYTNKVVIPPIYRSTAAFKEGLACVSKLDSTKFGYIDKKGNWIILPKYLRGNDFKDGYALVFKDKTTYGGSDNGGIIDKKGNEIIPLKYDYITIEDNFFIVKEKTKSSYPTIEKYGIIDRQGNSIKPVEYDNIKELYKSNDYYILKKGSKYTVVDKFAKPINNTEYDYITDFTEAGISYYKIGKAYTIINKSFQPVLSVDDPLAVTIGKQDKFAVLQTDEIKVYNTNGKLIKIIAQDNINQYSTFFTNNDDSLKIGYNASTFLYDIPSQRKVKLNYSEVGDFNEDGVFLAKNTFLDFLDYNGKVLNPKSYSNAVNFSDGICGVQDNSYSKSYLADKNFSKIKEISEVFIGPYSEGLAKGKGSYGNYVYYFDKKGNTFYISGAVDGSDFMNGRAYMKDYTSQKYFFINKAGKKINSETYDAVSNFSENIAMVKKGTKVGFIDTSGNIVIPFQYDAGSVFQEGVAMVKNGNEFYLIDTKGKKINNNVYNGASNPENATFPVQKGTNIGLINEKGKTIIDYKYQDVTPMSEGICWAKKDGKWGLLNDKGKSISDFIYDMGNPCKNGYITVGINNQLGLLDKTGKIILPLEYNKIGSVFKEKVVFIINSGNKTIAIE